MKETVYDELRSSNFGFEYAVPCKVCSEYYPGDCFRDGCKDPTCTCDGCNIHFKRDDECKCSPIEVCDACLLDEGHWSELKRLKPEKPGVILCQECGRKLTQGSPSCVRCGKCSRLRRDSKNTE